MRWYWPDDDVWVYDEVDADGWCLRHLEVRAVDARTVAAGSLAEVLAAQDNGANGWPEGITVDNLTGSYHAPDRVARQAPRLRAARRACHRGRWTRADSTVLRAGLLADARPLHAPGEGRDDRLLDILDGPAALSERVCASVGVLLTTSGLRTAAAAVADGPGGQGH